MTNGLFGGCFGHFNMYHHLKSDQDQGHCAKNIILGILKIREGSLLTCKICTEMFEWLAQLLFLIELRSLCLKVIVLFRTLIWIEWKRSFLWNQKSQQCEKRRSALSLNVFFVFKLPLSCKLVNPWQCYFFKWKDTSDQ